MFRQEPLLQSREITTVQRRHCASLCASRRRVIRRIALCFIAAVKLPNGDRADLGTKLLDYSLNPWHRHGEHKARVLEFAGRDGRAYALLPIPAEKLMVLRDVPKLVIA